MISAFLKYGGAEENWTLGLLNAIQALSQLSYSPTAKKTFAWKEAGGQAKKCGGVKKVFNFL